MNPAASPTRRSLRRHALAGGVAVLLLIGGVGGWAATVELSGAVVASGTIVVDTNVKKVQHPTGGIVGELLIREGARVRQDDVLLRLDQTLTRANLAIVVKGLDELAARHARLEAERDETTDVAFPRELTERAFNPDVARILSGEQKLFDLRRLARQGQKAQLRERIAQLREEIQGLVGQAFAKEREIELIGKELESVRTLWAKNLVPISRLTALEREAVRLEGERSQLLAMAAQAKGRTTETELQVIQIDQELRSEVARELREIQAKTAELVERKVAADDQLKRVEIRAPQDGIVHQLAVHTIGGVISAGEPIMLIVPEADELTIEARIAPQDIDQLRIGQPATVHFVSFDRAASPEIEGRVNRISADIAEDSRTGVQYYLVRIGMDPAELARLDGLKLVPGMPVEAFFRTNERTMFAYLMKPLRDQIAKAFRER